MVMRLQRIGVFLDADELLTHPRSPLWSILLNFGFLPQTGPSTFILDHQDENSQMAGLVQMRPRPGRREQDVVFIAPALDRGNGVSAIWQRLLTYLCVQAGEQGSYRLYARLPEQGEALQIFKNVGFLEYSRETIYRFDPANHSAAVSAAKLKLRPQESGDGWGLQKLYTAQTPRAVQHAEGLAQGQWELPRRRGSLQGYVWELDGELWGALHLRSGKRGQLIRTLLHPEAIDQAAELGRAALELAQWDRPIYFAFRHYQAGWRHTLPELGFGPFLDQTLVVKHMTVRMREKLPVLRPSLEKSPPEGVTPGMVSYTPSNDMWLMEK